MTVATIVIISIHSLRMEGDYSPSTCVFPLYGFQSTPSVWRETTAKPKLRTRLKQSPFQSTPSVWRETASKFIRSPSFNYFNPLPPYGGRHCFSWAVERGGSFQSTPSVWRETNASTHLWNAPTDFNPLPPYGGRQGLSGLEQAANRFQSTPSVWRETLPHWTTFKATVFQSTPSVWRETDDHLCRRSYSAGFQSTPSVWRETAKLHRKAFFISPILVQSCKKGCKRLHSAPEKMIFFEKREKNSVRNLQHLSVRL